MGELVRIAKKKGQSYAGLVETSRPTIFHDFRKEDSDLDSGYSVNHPRDSATEPPFLCHRRRLWNETDACVTLRLW